MTMHKKENKTSNLIASLSFVLIFCGFFEDAFQQVNLVEASLIKLCLCKGFLWHLFQK